MHIFVVGGSGFVGSAVCRAAVLRGFRVSSLARSPPKSPQPAWAAKVAWHTGDALSPETYASLLKGTDAVVHTVGTLFESTAYKQFLKPSGSRAERTTYAASNRDAALAVAQAAAAEDSVKTFLFMSASSAPPFVDKRYIETKRETEGILLAQQSFKSVIFRPSFIFDENDIATSALALGMRTLLLATAPLKPCAQRFVPSTNQLVTPLSVNTVGQAVIQVLLDPTAQGVFDAEDIRRLALAAN